MIKFFYKEIAKNKGQKHTSDKEDSMQKKVEGLLQLIEGEEKYEGHDNEYSNKLVG